MWAFIIVLQESFEMNHETLYLAIKLVDLYLGKVNVKREKLQLVGTTALYIAAKYDVSEFNKFLVYTIDYNH